ncbi:MAG: iron-sulfur cluster assembly protein [Bacteroidota bacterium]
MYFKDKEFNKQEEELVTILRTVYDPEIPVNIFDLGLIYNIEIGENKDVDVTMTLTAPNCPLADEVLAEVHEAVKSVPWVQDVNVTLTFDPPWDRDMMSEAAMLELGLL